MSKFQKFSAGPQPKPKITKSSPKGNILVDWKDIENLRRTMSPSPALGVLASRRHICSELIYCRGYAVYW